MSHQVFVDKMLSVLSTPMVFLAESSFVIARSKVRLRTGENIRVYLQIRGAFAIIVSTSHQTLVHNFRVKEFCLFT